MMRNYVFRSALALALLGSSGAALAGNVTLSGSMTGLGVTGPDASCAPLAFRGTISPASSTGTSSFGNFTYSHNICLGGADAPSNGTFAFDFGTDAFQGTMDGGATSTATPGVSAVAWTYTILSGTGRFLGASGTFQGEGLTDARTRPAQVSVSFLGSINAPAVPEPATWAMMILGFGGIGMAMRRARRHPMIKQLA